MAAKHVKTQHSAKLAKTDYTHIKTYHSVLNAQNLVNCAKHKPNVQNATPATSKTLTEQSLMNPSASKSASTSKATHNTTMQ